MKNPYQGSLQGLSDAFLLRLDTTPGRVGNTLLAVHDWIGSEIEFTWVDLLFTTAYNLRAALAKGIGFPLVPGTGASGSAGIQIPYPPDPIVFFNLTAVNCTREGPM